MGNIFANSKPAAKREVEEDYVGGGGLLDTDIYTGTIKYAYIGKAANSGARNLTLAVTIGSTEVTRQIWMTNRDGEVTYKDKKTGDLKNLPGYNQVNALTMLLCSKEVGDMDVEDKTLSLYDYESKKEIPQSVPCFVDLHGLELQVAIQRQTLDKTEKNEATGNYEPNGETRDVNEFIKFFPADKAVTLGEVAQFISSLGGDFDDVLSDGDLDKAIAKMEVEMGGWAEKWLDKNRGQTWDRSTGKKEGKAFGGSAKSGGGSSKPKSNLFDD
ncbi:single strand DNA binding protein [Roseobacter phage RD-1410W1-01]|uniref:Single-stranded DNA-binding protein n=1 Tax=Roseobacter phage RD-1410W1-01 TaxID=1815984 RepID=A0A191VYK8_9CAUD|nr:single strand DNA binding protein [Roseobacter phage RD-1410W1-01]ANJ20795.1 single-stranded DNA-binding protein [Roseobacter phage RD-1410W1-01]